MDVLSLKQTKNDELRTKVEIMPGETPRDMVVDFKEELHISRSPSLEAGSSSSQPTEAESKKKTNNTLGTLKLVKLDRLLKKKPTS